MAPDPQMLLCPACETAVNSFLCMYALLFAHTLCISLNQVRCKGKLRCCSAQASIRVRGANTAPLNQLFETTGVSGSSAGSTSVEGATYLQPGGCQTWGVLGHCLEVQHRQAVRKGGRCRLRNPGRLNDANSLLVFHARFPIT